MRETWRRAFPYYGTRDTQYFSRFTFYVSILTSSPRRLVSTQSPSPVCPLPAGYAAASDRPTTGSDAPGFLSAVSPWALPGEKKAARGRHQSLRRECRPDDAPKQYWDGRLNRPTHYASGETRLRLPHLCCVIVHALSRPATRFAAHPGDPSTPKSD